MCPYSINAIQTWIWMYRTQAFGSVMFLPLVQRCGSVKQQGLFRVMGNSCVWDRWDVPAVCCGFFYVKGFGLLCSAALDHWWAPATWKSSALGFKSHKKTGEQLLETKRVANHSDTKDGGSTIFTFTIHSTLIRGLYKEVCHILMWFRNSHDWPQVNFGWYSHH